MSRTTFSTFRSADRRRVAQSPGGHPEVSRPERLGRQAALEQLDAARQRRLEQLPAIPDPRFDPGPEQPLDDRVQRQRRPAPAARTRAPFLERSLAVQRQRALPGALGPRLRANFYGRQGYPKPLLVVVDTGRPATGELDILIDRVDTFRFDNVYELDFRLQKTLTIGPVEVVVAAELFNVANANTVLQSERRVGTYAPGGCGPPRLRWTRVPVLRSDLPDPEPAHRTPERAVEF